MPAERDVGRIRGLGGTLPVLRLVHFQTVVTLTVLRLVQLQTVVNLPRALVTRFL